MTMVTAGQITIDVHADQEIATASRLLTGACIEDVNHEIYGGIYSQMIFGESFQEPPPPSSLKGSKTDGGRHDPLPPDQSGTPAQISGMWRSDNRGNAVARYALIADHPFIGVQSQQITFESGAGEVGIENRGLNHWGMNYVGGKPYEGYVWARARKPTALLATMESRDGSKRYASQEFTVAAGDWQRLDIALTPDADDANGQFGLKLEHPGSVTIGYVFLQPGPWGRFKGLPVRGDVAQGLIQEGITVLRYGGSMVNSPNYRLKNMFGPRDRRPPYAGTWYRYSSNGWGVIDFLNLCEAAGFIGVPDLNVNESPHELADFVKYINGPPDSQWGGRRVSDGHARSYQQRYIELGNEERVDDQYADKFEALASAIWQKDPKMILIVGDFAYHQTIKDPFNFKGSASGITTLAAHQRILRFAKAHDGQVWFDVHLDTEHPVPSNSSLMGMLSFTDALTKVADGAGHKVVVFELNANNHAQKRALANALAIDAITRDGRTPIVCSANGLQPDSQNDNGWNQGLLFLNPWKVWLQPPGYVTQALSRNYQRQVVRCDVAGGERTGVDVTATRSQDGKSVVLRIVNPGNTQVSSRINLMGFSPATTSARVTELAAGPEAVNTAAATNSVYPRQSQWPHGAKDGYMTRVIPPDSFTLIRFE